MKKIKVERGSPKRNTVMVAVATSEVHNNRKFSRFRFSRELLMPKSRLDIASLIPARNSLQSHSWL
jgi:hypothetical protein